MTAISNSARSASRSPPKASRRALPWRDPAGRFSWLKLVVFVALWIPAAVIAYQLAAGLLGGRALNQAVHLIGSWGLRLILISLAIRPFSRLFDWPRLMLLRRMIGVAAFFYCAAHLGLYVADEAFDLVKVASEIVSRFYLTIGFVALLILLALALTSTDGMTRRIGGRRWLRIHRLVYLAALLSVVHFFLQTKAGPDEPWVTAGLFAWLMLWRAAVRVRRRPNGLPALLQPALAISAALLTAVGEAIYYNAKLGAPVESVLQANLMADLFPRPAAVVLIVCLIVSLVPLVRLGLRNLAGGRVKTA